MCWGVIPFILELRNNSIYPTELSCGITDFIRRRNSMRAKIFPNRKFLFKSWVLLITISLLASSVLAAAPVLSIDSVGGKKVVNGEVKGSLNGKVLVQGTAIPSTPNQTPPPQPKPLVADAGDSGFAAVGERITLLGAGYGGKEPYTFSWSTPVGTVEGADAPTAQLITTGVQPGTYTLQLAIRDSAGATASDMVKVVVYQPQQRTLLDQSKNDATPGVLSAGVPGTILFPFSVPANTTRIDVRISWTLPVNDYDLRILDPKGVEANHHGDSVPTTEENASVSNPVAGTWNVAADKFTTVTDTVRAQVQGIVGPADPRPVVRAGGPYRFSIGATQTFSGTVTGGTAPISSGWATDANGFERREMVSVLVADQARLAAETTAITIVAVNDSGVNPYHLEFSAQTYPDPDVLALTKNFTRHPSEYIPGYPTTSQAIHATLGQGYFPMQDKDLWSLKDATHPNGLEYGKLYWIPGTKIIGG